MEELSIEQKAKRYDEAIKRLEDITTGKSQKTFMFTQGLFDYIFPELKESMENDDEKIINNIKKVIWWYRGMFTEKSLMPEEYQEIDAWLEKQGEHKPTAEEVLIKAGLKPYKDGNQWCVLLGDNIQEGICGFGNTIEDALYAFLKDLIASKGEQKLNGTFVNVDDIREDFVQEVYRVLDADSTNDRANQIIDAFDNLPTVTIEKQGERKHQYKSRPRYVGEGELLGKKVAKIEPKYAEIVRTNFKDGDWVVYQNETFQVRSLPNGSRLLQGKKYQTYFIDELCRPWTIQDAKDGDVLACDTNIIIYGGYINNYAGRIGDKAILAYCGWNGENLVINNKKTVGFGGIGYIPATKEQRAFLFKKMNEAGYVWSSCKKELRKIGQTLAHCMFCNDDYTDEDRKVLCDGCNEDCKFKQKPAAWKPSKEQIIALRWVLNNIPYNKHKEEISGLIEQIKDFV